MLENYFEGIIHDLVVNHVVSSFKVLKREVGDDDCYLRVKCALSNGDILEFAEYIRVTKNMTHLDMYSFHWQSADGKLMKRWDNVKHHKEVGTYPYHLHLPDGTVNDSEPMNLRKVLAEIGKVLPVKDMDG